VKDAVFYHIFPDRFANGDPGLDPPNVRPWGTRPTVRGFQGGDLKGIADHFDTLLDLGINAIYLNPIFMAASTHRYDTIDYLRIDPKLGTLADFHALIKTAHQNGVRVILDGVFNHCARGFFAFNDILENGADSPYLHWFHIKKFPLRAYERGRARNYAAWWGIKSLPKLNTAYPPVRRYLLDVARYWIEQGADGWRLDVPNEIDDDSFWAEFRSTVHSANPEAYILGEIWDGNPRWVGETHFDGLMNYPVRTAVLEYLKGKIKSSQFLETLAGVLALYPPENVYAMYNLVGSHDTERVITHLNGDGRKSGLAHFLTFTFPGAPAIYYGDEIGLPGGKDPDCRGAFPWDQEQWDNALRTWLKTLVQMRKDVPAFRRGGFQALAVQDSPACCAYARTLEGQPAIAAVNAGNEPVTMEIPVNGLGLNEGQRLRELTGGSDMVVRDGKIQATLAGWQGLAWG
jgi:glycosidase